MWDVRTHDLVREDDILASFLVLLCGLNPSNNPTELTSTTGLLLVCIIEFGACSDGFTIGDTGLAGGALNVVLTAHTLNVNFQVELAHSRDDGLNKRQMRIHLILMYAELTSLLSLSIWTRKVGSSRLKRLSAREKLGDSWPTGFNASEMTGSGTNIED